MHHAEYGWIWLDSDFARRREAIFCSSRHSFEYVRVYANDFAYITARTDLGDEVISCNLSVLYAAELPVKQTEATGKSSH